MKQSDGPRVCDYEGSPYRTAFWEDADRAFEDAAEREALRRMLPATGGRLVEIGAGFGRLAPLYGGYGEVLLVDYARSMLEDARRRNGPYATYVNADLYRLPFADASIDTVVQVRVLHHVEDVPAALAEVTRTLRAGGSYVLEHANKRHLKAIARYLLGHQAESPFDQAPHEFVPLNWNFHPRWIDRQLTAAGLEIRNRRAVSHFRHPGLKRVLPAPLLARLDAHLGGLLGGLALAPSRFVRALRPTGPPRRGALWRCPACEHQPLRAAADHVPCPSCGRHWPIVDGIHLFRLDAAQ